jgi:3-oxoacyl-(acyl-carrier-protein) synthase
MLVSEAAAALLLERIDEQTSGDILIDRYAFAGDAGHLTGFDPSAKTLSRLLRVALAGRPVDVIQAHGTGTVANDANEVTAIDDALSELTADSQRCSTPVYSHKGALGHSLGAAGLVSVVLNVAMHEEGIVLPNTGLQTSMDSRHAIISIEKQRRPVRRSIACAAGFGGATAVVSLSQIR